MNAEQNGTSELAEKLGDVRASIRPNLDVSRHIFSGKPTYLLRDPVTAQTHRFSVEDYQLLIAIDQSRTLKESLALLIQKQRLTEDQAENFYKFVVHLHQLGLLSLPLGDGTALYKRYKTRHDASKKASLVKLLFMKLPLAKPDKWLGRTLQFACPLFTKQAFIIWLIAMVASGIVLIANWREFISPLGTMLALSNVPMLWFLLVTLKAFHELGHAYACKRFGGSVPEMGVILMMGTPCAYVDASTSWSFPNRWHRMFVAMAGMYFESIAAMVALAIWLMTDTGHIHSAAQYAIVLSTVITVGFNANPLMRYDGYFILSDVLNIPNLHRDAKTATTGMIKSILFGIPLPETSDSRLRQTAMSAFGLMCMLYQVTVMLGIATLILLATPVIGPIAAALVSGVPAMRFITKNIDFIFRSQELAPVRGRAIIVSGSLFAVVLGFFLLIPIPGRIQVKGVVHRLDEHSIRAGVDGFLVSQLACEGAPISCAQTLFRLDNQELITRRAELVSQAQQLNLQVQNEIANSSLKAEQLRIQLNSANEELADLDTKISQLDVVAHATGELALLPSIPQVGKFIRKGEHLGQLVHGPWIIRSKLTAEQWTNISRHLDAHVYVRLMGMPQKTMAGRIVRAMPVGSKKIEQVALTQLGGGDIAV
ncbi:MAG TPA: hypothetical protein DDZ51_26845, partial [Planctomycetaceae bacterium]|nr:hypothetical protein [Planctomycetaceae bacterium]